jgi:integrase
LARRSTGPWFRDGRGWFVTIGKKQFKVAGPAATRQKAIDEWHKFMSKPRASEFTDAAPPGEISAKEVADRYLIWAKRNRAEATSDLAERYLKPWADALPSDLLAERVRPFDASEWIDVAYKRPGARRAAYRAVKAAWRWADESGLIDRNPLRGLKTPAGGRREDVLTPDEWKLALRAAGVAMRRLMRVARWTGMRAQEVIRVEARHIDRKTREIKFPRSEEKKKRQVRIVIVVGKAWKIVEAAAKRHPKGPILRNEDRKPWTKNAAVCNMRRIRERLARDNTPIPGLCLTTLRHTYATDAIERGVDVITLAELMGHKDAKMLAEVYAKVGQRREHMRDAAEKAVRG